MIHVIIQADLSNQIDIKWVLNKQVKLWIKLHVMLIKVCMHCVILDILLIVSTCHHTCDLQIKFCACFYKDP